MLNRYNNGKFKNTNIILLLENFREIHHVNNKDFKR